MSNVSWQAKMEARKVAVEAAAKLHAGHANSETVLQAARRFEDYILGEKEDK